MNGIRFKENGIHINILLHIMCLTISFDKDAIKHRGIESLFESLFASIFSIVSFDLIFCCCLLAQIVTNKKGDNFLSAALKFDWICDFGAGKGYLSAVLSR